MSLANARRSFFGALLALASACQTSSIHGATTGSEGPAPCPANATREPDGTCDCLPDYSVCHDGGEAICVQVLVDSENCGECGNACASGESCLGGECECHLITCPVDGGTICTDMSQDPLNCGACGFPCPTSEHCLEGFCGSCPFPTVYCGPDAGLGCVDVTTDNNNCGGCGVACDTYSACGMAGDGGFACLCLDGGPGTNVQSCEGSCVDLDHDTNDCGACGNVCYYGACFMGDAGTGVCPCNPPLELCGSTCIDPSNDFNHCGGCTACTPPSTQCVGGFCQ